MTLQASRNRMFTGFSPVHSHDTLASNRDSGLFYRGFGKRLLDLAVLALILPLILPVLVASIVVLRVSGVQPFYSQLRIGQGGRHFRIWKLQTMMPNADAVLKDLLAQDDAARHEWNSTQKLKNDPRVTRFGHFLRKTSIDELPQLWNVLRGDMSLLGPRPMMLDQMEIYGPSLPAYLSLRPGISGKWQVSERNDADFRRRAEIDFQYAQELSFTNDLRLVWQTIRTVIRSTGY